MKGSSNSLACCKQLVLLFTATLVCACVRGSQCYAQMQNSSIDSLLSHQLKIVCCLASSFFQDLLDIDSKVKKEREKRNDR